MVDDTPSIPAHLKGKGKASKPQPSDGESEIEEDDYWPMIGLCKSDYVLAFEFKLSFINYHS